MRGAIVLLAGLAFAGGANAAPPAVTAVALPGRGVAPVRVTLAAAGDAATVRSGRVTQVVHVSTGATGNTPLGSWRAYRKVGGWDWVLWYPMYFKGGFAIHGYPSVPAYPASHGCVRIPMWIAPALFGTNDYGATVVVHL